jgi:hypothetical protein
MRRVKNVRTACNLSEFCAAGKSRCGRYRGESEAGIGVAYEFDGCERGSLEVLKCEMQPVDGTFGVFDCQNCGF